MGRLGHKAGAPGIWPLKGRVLDTLAERSEGLLILLRVFKLMLIKLKYTFSVLNQLNTNNNLRK